MENRKFFGYSQLCRSRFLYVKRHFTYSTICEWYSVIFGLGVITQRSYPHFMIPTRIENRTCHIATRLVLYRQIITAEITYTLYVKTKVLYVKILCDFPTKSYRTIFFSNFLCFRDGLSTENILSRPHALPTFTYRNTISHIVFSICEFTFTN